MQTFRSILNEADSSVAAGFIHALAPLVLQFLHSEQARRVTSSLEMALTVECLAVVETLVSLADPQHRKYLNYYYYYFSFTIT